MSTATHLLHQPLRLHEPESPGVQSADSLHGRIQMVIGNCSFRELGDLVGMNAETVRRYVRGADPSVGFVTRLCDAFGVSAEWLLHGRGPQERDTMQSHALRSAGYAALLAALAERLESSAAPPSQPQRPGIVGTE